MSFYDDASWLLIPSGIEEDIVFAQKPISGLGDLSFTRASDATYTDSTGVVRRSPYNMIRNSTMVGAVAGSPGTAPTNWAISNAGLTQTIVGIGNESGLPYIDLRFNGTATSIFFELRPETPTGIAASNAQIWTFASYLKFTSGSIPISLGIYERTSAGSFITSGQAMVSVTSTLQRFAFTRTLSGGATVGAVQPTIISGLTNGAAYDFTIRVSAPQMVEGNQALDFFPTSDRLNVPRIDFRNADGTLSSCGRLLLEPQRTNLMTYSEAFTNASWSKVATASGTITVTDNYNISPAGTSTASRLVINNLNAAYVAKAFTSVNATIYTMSIWAKSNTSSNYTFQLRDGYSGSVSGNLTVTPTLQRFTFTFTASGTTAELQFRTIVLGSYDVSIWGAQLEAGAYATSYIPTTTAAVTRLADVASKTGVSSLIGQNSGTLFVEWDNSDKGFINLLETYNNTSGVTGTSTILIQKTVTPNQINIRVFDSLGNYNDLINVTLLNGTNKLALAYQPGSAVYYLNGSFVGSNTRTYVFVSTRDTIGFDNRAPYPRAQAAIFPTRLTNAELAQLTTL